MNPTAFHDTASSKRFPLETLFALVWGISLTLCITGYTFGQSNHHVYLLDALYVQHPENLARDWFTTHTLQYHVLYTRLVVLLDQIGLLKTGFFILYLGLVVAMHWAWLRLVRQIGGTLLTYMISVLIYHVSAGGLGLGVYQFLQDGSFLPSNISAVAALMALTFWIDRRLIAAGICVGIAGLFHLNYSLVLIGVWGLFTLIALWREPEHRPVGRYVLASVIAMTPCLFNVGIAASHALQQVSKIPIEQFVPLYVKLRHPHHYDAMSWPIALWISFLWPVPFALLALRRLPVGIVRDRTRDTLFLALGIQLFAVTFAGVWFVSETIVQMSLFRFSIFAKILSCILTAWLIERSFASHRNLIAAAIGLLALGLFAVLGIRNQLPNSIPAPSIGFLIGSGTLALLLAVAVVSRRAIRPVGWMTIAALPACIFLAASQQLGVKMPGEADDAMIEISRWARDHTPPNSLFLVPPSDSTFRLEAQRSAVIGFKHVPQLSGELVEWKRRLDEVLDCDILTLPTPMPETLAAMESRYRSLSSEHLTRVGSAYDCDYIIALRELPEWADRMEYHTRDGHYWLYRLHERMPPS